MAEKNRDDYQRWRSITIAFRVSPEENALLEEFVNLSGLSKQDYLTNNMLKRDIVVQGNPKVYKALKDKMTSLIEEIQSLEQIGDLTHEQTALIEMLCEVYDGMKEDYYNEENNVL